MSLGRIEDYNKNLPIVEIYTAVQSEGSRAGYPTVVIRTTGSHIGVISVKEGGVILGIQVYTLRKVNLALMTLLKHIRTILI